jgi:[acyl-carrier-protein] S-malonyltransferase
MRPAEERLEVDLAALDYAVFAFPIVHNVDALSNSEPSLVREKLTRQVSSPVRWLDSVRQLTALDVDTFVEVGPGKVLAGLVRQIDREVRCVNVGSYESLSSMLETI